MKRGRIFSCLYSFITAVVIVALVAVALLLTSCKTVKEIPIETTKIEYRYIDRVQTDSVFSHDSIYIKDRGDTVIEYRDRYVYKYKMLHDTSVVYRVDSVPYMVEVEKELTDWEQTKMNVGGIMIPLLLLLIFFVIGYVIRKVL